jgi:hypothetical protein
MKKKKYHTVGKIPKSNFKIVERGKIDTPNLQIHDLSLFLLGTVLWAQTSPLSEMVRSFKSFQHVCIMPIPTYNRANSVIIKNAIILNTIHNIFNLREYNWNQWVKVVFNTVSGIFRLFESVSVVFTFMGWYL